MKRKRAYKHLFSPLLNSINSANLVRKSVVTIRSQLLLIAAIPLYTNKNHKVFKDKETWMASCSPAAAVAQDGVAADPLNVAIVLGQYCVSVYSVLPTVLI